MTCDQALSGFCLVHHFHENSGGDGGRGGEETESRGQIYKALLRHKVKDSAYFVTAHTFCASRDTRVSYGWCLLNTGIFLRGLKLCRESRIYQVLLVSKKKIGGNHAFFRDNKASIWKKTPYIPLYFTAF